MANETLTADIILKEGKRIFKNSTPFLQNIQKQYDNSYEAYGAKAGTDIRIKTPQRYKTRTTKAMDVQDQDEKSVTLTRSNWLGIDLKFSQAELALDLDAFSEQYIEPATSTMGGELDYTLMGLAYKSVFNTAATIGDYSSVATAMQQITKIREFSAPTNGMVTSIVDPTNEAALVSSFSGLFQSSDKIAKQYIQGKMGVALGADWYMSQGINAHVRGASDGAYETNGAAQTGSSLIVDTGTGTLTEGDIFTLSGVNAVNRVTRKDTGKLQQFVVTADYAGGAGTVSIAPEIIITGAYQTVTAAPATNVVLTELGTASATYPQLLEFHKSAFAFGSIDIELPKNAEFAARNSEDGVSMSIIRDFDIQNIDTYCRMDMLWGFKEVVPEWACRKFATAT